MNELLQDKIRGVVYGAAVGDAFGAPYEFLTSSQLKEKYGTVSDMIAGGIKNWNLGEYTDDTDHALIVLESLLVNNTLLIEDVISRLVNWYDGQPKDIGLTTKKVLELVRNGENWLKASEKVWQQSNRNNLGNGGLMRAYPIALFHYNSRNEMYVDNNKNTMITHYDEICTEASYLFCLALWDILDTGTIDFKEMSKDRNIERLKPEQVFTDKTNLFNSNGYVLHSLQSAYWGFCSESFEEGVLKVVNAGNDTDTNASLAGALLGAKFGYKNIPQRWLGKIDTNRMTPLVEQLIGYLS